MPSPSTATHQHTLLALLPPLLPQTVTNNVHYYGHANDGVPGPSFSTGLLGACNTGGVPDQVRAMPVPVPVPVGL